MMRSINTLSLCHQNLASESRPEITMMGVLDLNDSVTETAMQETPNLQNEKTKSGSSLKRTPYMHLSLRLCITCVRVRSI